VGLPALSLAMATSHDIARLVGVSQSTVSRALRGDPRVTAQTRLRIEDAARELAYIPNAAARSLITSRTDTIALALADITNPFYPQLVDVLHGEFGRSGFRTILLHDRDETSPSREFVNQLSSGAVDGVVFMSCSLTSATPTAVAGRGTPVVLLNRELHDGRVADVVVSDNRGGGQLAAESLVKLGHRRIALISGPSSTSTGREREQGFRDGLANLKLALDETLRRESPYSHQGGYQAGLELLDRDRPGPTAIFCANDVVAFGVLEAAKRVGIDVPEQLSVIGFDDIEMAGWSAFDLTTIRQPLAQMAQTAARMLIERINDQGPVAPRRQVFPARLVARSTTAPPPGSAG
jgi:LacI family transcriptional regulator